MTWVALSYRLPREPSRLRLAVWRRLKRLGAVILHESIWLLPENPSTREALEWLAEEIEEKGGTAYLWEVASLSDAQDQEIIRRFRADADARYAALVASARGLSRLSGKEGRRSPARDDPKTRRRLAALERALRLARRRDYFRAPGYESALRAAETAAKAVLKSPDQRPRRSA